MAVAAHGRPPTLLSPAIAQGQQGRCSPGHVAAARQCVGAAPAALAPAMTRYPTGSRSTTEISRVAFVWYSS